MAHLLGAEAVHLEYPTQVVFESLTLGVNDGARIGIVGRNGDGKSSLLGLLTGRAAAGLRPGHPAQRLRVGAAEPGGHPRPAPHGRLDAGRRPGRTPVGRRRRGSAMWSAGWCPTSAGMQRFPRSADGQRRRVQLARLLVGEWDVIALDEPTNHLDIEGITWLADHLQQRWARNTGGLLLVTHDRWFLDEVATTTWEVHDGIVEPFEGGYAAYVLQRVERDRQAAADRGQAAEPDAQGAGLAAPGRAGAHLQAQVPHRRRQPADRRRAAAAQHRRAGQAGHRPAGQGRHRSARRVGLVRRSPGAARCRMADRPR